MSERGIIKDENKTKEQLIDELKELHKRITELELLEIRQRQVEEIFKKSEENYKTIFENLPFVTFTLDKKGRLLDANKCTEEVTGLRAKDFKGKSFSKFGLLSKKDLLKARFEFKKNLQGKVTGKTVYHVKLKDGKEIFLELIGIPLKENDKVTRVLVVGNDITERRRVEDIQNVLYEIANAVHTTRDLDELFKSIHRHLSRIVDTTNFFIALYNKKDDTLSLPYLVDEKIKFTSFPAGKSLTAYVIRANKPLLATEDDVNDLIKKGEAEIIGVPSKVWLGVPLKIGGETIGVVVVQSYTDPTRFTEEHLEILKFVSSQIALAIERKRTEESLKKSEEKYRTLAENINVGIFRSTPGAKGKFIEVNPAMVDMFGYGGKEELLAVNPSDLYQNPEDRARFNEKMLKDEFIKNEESISKRKDGTTFIASDTAVAVKDEKGKVMYYDGIIEDITDRKRVERTIKQLNEILRLINKIMRHDLLNDLNIANGALDVYAETKDEEFLNKSFKALGRGIELIRRMRELESLTTFGAELKECGIKEVAEDVIKNHSVEFNVNGDGIVLADEAFHSIIDNIVRNAIAHGKTDKIDITIGSKDNFCEIRIADYGIGIPDAIKEKVFKEGFSYGEAGGTGLGLYIVKETVERYGGDIHVEDNKPKGAVFVIKLKGGKK